MSEPRETARLAADADCPRCGGALRRRSALPLLLAPVALGLGAVGLRVVGRDVLTPLELLVVVTAAFVAFLLVLGPLARVWLGRSRCSACGASAPS